MRTEKFPYSWLRKPEQGLKLFLEVKERLLDKEWKTGKKKTPKGRTKTKNNKTSSMNKRDFQLFTDHQQWHLW
jgi:hypothetical protein